LRGRSKKINKKATSFEGIQFLTFTFSRNTKEKMEI
jgi:hypothetical protein